MKPRTLLTPSRAPLAACLALGTMLAGSAGTSEPPTAEPMHTAEAAAAGSPDDAATVQAPHVHDYWAGRERVTLLDAEIEVEASDALMWGVQTTRFLGETSFGGAFVSFPEGTIVYEGTGRMEITVTWSDPSISGLRFLHKHAGSGDIQPWTVTPNAEPVVLEVAPDMTDMPHAQTSRWVFLMAATGTPAVAVGSFHVRIDIVKTQDVAEWPAHPDLWEGEERLTIASAEGHTAASAGPTEMAESHPWAEPEDAVLAERLVPMEATTLRVLVTILEVGDELPVERLHLLARSADDVSFDFDDQGEPVAVSDDGLTWTWERAIEMDETDNVYAETSAWAFRVVAATAEAPVPGCGMGCYEAELRYRLEAVVEKGAPAA